MPNTCETTKLTCWHKQDVVGAEKVVVARKEERKRSFGRVEGGLRRKSKSISLGIFVFI